MSRHMLRTTVLLPALAAVAALLSCDQVPSRSLLTPTGIPEDGEDGGGSGFISLFTKIQVVGDFNGFNDGVPGMSEIDGGIWADTLRVTAGCYFMKFRTNDDWDETPDFGRCEGTESDCQVAVPIDGTQLEEGACDDAVGTGTAIGQVEFLEDASYEFLLDETTSPNPTYRIKKVEDVGALAGTVAFIDNPSPLPGATVAVLEGGTQTVAAQVLSDSTGAYLVADLAPATYDVRVSAAGYISETVPGVAVVAFQTTAVAPVTLTIGCSYFYTAMQVVGDFNGFDDTVPSMSQIGSCVWADTLDITAGCYFMKFRTNNDWDAEPDFGRCTGAEGPCQITVPLDGTFLTDSTCAVKGQGTAIGEVEFLADGTYEFLLDEAGPGFSIRSLTQIPTGSVSGMMSFSDMPSTSPAVTVTVFDAGTSNQVATGMSDPVDDSFRIANLLSGPYDLEFRATGYLTGTQMNVTVNAPADTPLGTVTLMKGGSISGVMAFSDMPATSPTVTVTVFDAGTSSTVAAGASDPVDDSFQVGTLPSGFYDVLFQAVNYADTTASAVSVMPPTDTSLGTVTMTKSCVSTATRVDIQFLNNPAFPAQTMMTQTQPCLWSVTLTLPVGCASLQLPLDFFGSGVYTRCSGSEAGCQFPIPSDGSTFAQNVCNDPTPLVFFGEIDIQVAGDYEFTVDEGAAPDGEAVLSIRKLP